MAVLHFFPRLVLFQQIFESEMGRGSFVVIVFVVIHFPFFQDALVSKS